MAQIATSDLDSVHDCYASLLDENIDDSDLNSVDDCYADLFDENLDDSYLDSADDCFAASLFEEILDDFYLDSVDDFCSADLVDEILDDFYLDSVDDCFAASLFEENLDDSYLDSVDENLVDSDLDSLDDFYLAPLFDENLDEINPVSDGKYAEELQEALMSSAITASQTKNLDSNFVPLVSFQEKSDEKTVSSAKSGESSLRYCEICVERKESDEMFAAGGCVHSFCTTCISQYVKTRVEDSVTVITCPGVSCRTVLELDTCRPVLPKGVLDLWEHALCEKLIDDSERFYCPFKDCSAVMLNDNSDSGEVMRESECPFCHRLFCAECKVPWHPGVDCAEFQRLNEDERGREDLMLREIAKEKNWGRCPHCKFYVERTDGCPHMTCRCGFEFCYGCGEVWNASHGGCTRN